MCTTDLRSIIHFAFYTTQVHKLTAHMHDRCILVEYRRILHSAFNNAAEMPGIEKVVYI